MSKLEVLEQIKDAEKRVDVDIQGARKKKEESIAEAKRRSLRLLEEAQATADHAQEETLTAARHDIEHEKQAIISEGKAHAEKITKLARTKVQRATEHLLDEFKRSNLEAL